MNSHQYDFDAKWLCHKLGLVLVFLVFGAVVLRMAAPYLPSSRNTWDMDRTIMAHQADAASQVNDADILLIGDSSCLMNIDASIVSEQLDAKVLNLGTVSFLNIEMFGALLSRYFETATHLPSTVVLVTHPDFLRRSSPSRSHVDWLKLYLDGKEDTSRKRTWKSLNQWLGSGIIQGRLARILPRPLSVEFGKQFGFTKDLETYMDHHGGSALDPRSLDASKLRGSREYRISTPNQKAALEFAQIIPPDVNLYVALSPLPQGFADQNLITKLEKLITEWGTLMHAEKVLTSLPISMPDDQFASKTHINPDAVDQYSKGFSNALR